VPHRFRNASATLPMKILWIYASTDATRTLLDSGVTNPVALETSDWRRRARRCIRSRPRRIRGESPTGC